MVAILDSTGTAVVNYTYDAWGAPVSRTGTMANTLGTLNPLRYRGYVYDQETGLYYLQSRYYKPNMGRFLNADAFAATGQGLLGNNMFAYCGNNPVLNRDTQGTRHEISAGAGGCFTNPGPTVSLGQIIKQNIKNTVKDTVIDTVINDDPSVTLDSLDQDGVGFYKGTPVINTPGMGDASFSFGVIFMGGDVIKDNDTTLLKHEYGHIVQLSKLGIPGYTKYVVIPSVVCFWASQGCRFLEDNYFNLPWEHKANRYGGVQAERVPGVTSVADAYWCYAWGMTKLNPLFP